VGGWYATALRYNAIFSVDARIADNIQYPAAARAVRYPVLQGVYRMPLQVVWSTDIIPSKGKGKRNEMHPTATYVAKQHLDSYNRNPNDENFHNLLFITIYMNFSLSEAETKKPLLRFLCLQSYPIIVVHVKLVLHYCKKDRAKILVHVKWFYMLIARRWGQY
jgi:hypothetical protein